MFKHSQNGWNILFHLVTIKLRIGILDLIWHDHPHCHCTYCGFNKIPRHLTFCTYQSQWSAFLRPNLTRSCMISFIWASYFGTKHERVCDRIGSVFFRASLFPFPSITLFVQTNSRVRCPHRSFKISNRGQTQPISSFNRPNYHWTCCAFHTFRVFYRCKQYCREFLFDV